MGVGNFPARTSGVRAMHPSTNRSMLTSSSSPATVRKKCLGSCSCRRLTPVPDINTLSRVGKGTGALPLKCMLGHSTSCISRPTLDMYDLAHITFIACWFTTRLLQTNPDCILSQNEQQLLQSNAVLCEFPLSGTDLHLGQRLRSVVATLLGRL